jgi:hypothetical protein
MSKLDEKIDELREILPDLGEMELKTMQYSLADAIREGCLNTTQAHNWGDGENVCAMSAAVMAARARGYEV